MENDLKSLAFKFYKRKLESSTSIKSSFVMIALVIKSKNYFVLTVNVLYCLLFSPA